MEKKSFVLYGDYKAHFALLSAEEQGQLLMAIFEYVEEGTQPALSPAAMMAFSFIRLQLDRDEARYAETCQRRQEAGKKSGEARRNKREQKQAEGTPVPFVQQTGTNETDNENETDTENDIENENVTESVPPISPQGGTEAPSPLLRRLLPHYTLQIELQDRIDKNLSAEQISFGEVGFHHRRAISIFFLQTRGGGGAIMGAIPKGTNAFCGADGNGGKCVLGEEKTCVRCRKRIYGALKNGSKSRKKARLR